MQKVSSAGIIKANLQVSQSSIAAQRQFQISTMVQQMSGTKIRNPTVMIFVTYYIKVGLKRVKIIYKACFRDEQHEL